MTSLPIQTVEISTKRTPILRKTVFWHLSASFLLFTYIFLYNYAYDNYLSVVYFNFGFSNKSTSKFEMAFAISCCLIVQYLLPRIISRGSHFFSWMVYYILFVPMAISTAKVGTIPGGAISLIALVTISFIFMIAISRLLVFRIPKDRSTTASSEKQRNYGIGWIVGAFIFSTTSVFLLYGEIMSISGIDEIYIQREIASKIIVPPIARYLLNWHLSVFSPLLVAYGLVKRKGLYVFLGFSGFFLVYSVNGAKISFAIFAMMLAINGLFRIGLLRKPFLIAIIPLAATAAIVVLVKMSGTYFSDLVLFISSQVFMRAIGIQAVMLSVYVEFFSQSPLTYYSHIGVISSFVSYPYQEPLGVVVGQYLTSAGFNANSGFWVTDGIAAAGYSGLIFIGILMGFILSLLNYLGRNADLRFICLASIPFIMAAINTSIFTSLITSGGILISILSPLVFRGDRRINGSTSK